MAMPAASTASASEHKSVRGSSGVRTTERAEVWENPVWENPVWENPGWENPKVVDTRVAIVAS
jgi:predicted lipoprotein